MAVMADRPYTGANFLVTIGDGDSRSPAAGFSEVIFPAFGLDDGQGADGRPIPGSPASGPAAEVLVLRRGAIGSLDLYGWWDETRRAKKPVRRPVTIELLADDQRTVVMTWRFQGAYPVSLSYSPLRAAEPAIVTETVALRFERVDMK